MKDWTGNAKSIYATLGASNHTDAEREDNDFYATEPKALILLLERETFDDLIWEPACGKGHLSEVLKQSGYIVKSTDLVDRGYGKSGVDFLKCTTPFNGDIITNPPYKYAQKFVEHALELIPNGHKVAMFLKLTFLESKNRRSLFESNPPPFYICLIEQTAVRKRWRLRYLSQSRNSSSIRLVHMGKRVPRGAGREVV